MTDEVTAPPPDLTKPHDIPPGAQAMLGRLIQKDPRNAQYPLPKRALPKTVRKKMWNALPPLDQGNTSQCVAYTGYQWLRTGPITNLRAPKLTHGEEMAWVPPFEPSELYVWAQQADEWPGENYDGTSGLGLMKALKERGYITEYRWALDVDTIFAWLLTSGPVCMGTYWYRDMFTPTKDGWIQPMGPEEGGHEYLLIGADLDKKCPYDGSVGAVRMLNSWGDTWGQKGRAWISKANLDYLLKHDGDCCTATEVKK